MAVGTRGERPCLSPKTSARAGALCCYAMSKSEATSEFCLLIIFSGCGDAERVLVREFAGDEARPLGPVLGYCGPLGVSEW